MVLDEIQAKFGGEWKMDRSENVEVYMKEMRFNAATAKSAATGKVDEKIEVKDGKICIILKNDDQFIKEDLIPLDEQFNLVMNQVNRKALAFYKDGKLEMNAHPIDSDLPPNKVVREIIDGKMVVTMYVHDVVAKRIFKPHN